MKNPLVSIILPTYNRSSQLPKAILSCLNQTYENIELIVIDDGSKDKTKQVVKKLSKEDSRIYYHKKENGGLPNALNYGFNRAKGEFLTWTSDDNQYRNNAIETMLNYLNFHPDVGLVNANMTVIDNEGKKFEKELPGTNIPEENSIGACFLYRKGVYNKIGNYNEDFSLAEDYDYWIRVWKNFKIGHINKSLYVYSIGNDTMTIRDNWKIQIMTSLLKYSHGFININDVSDFLVDSQGGDIVFGKRTNEIKRITKTILENLIAQKTKFTSIGEISFLLTNMIKICSDCLDEEKAEKERLAEEIIKLENSTLHKLNKRLGNFL